MVTFVVYLSLLLWYFYGKDLDGRPHCRSLTFSNAVLARICPCDKSFFRGLIPMLENQENPRKDIFTDYL